MRSFVVVIEENCVVPRFYGIAWRQHLHHRSVCMPFPFSRVAGLARRLCHWMLGCGKLSVIDAAFIRGVQFGRIGRESLTREHRLTVDRLVREKDDAYSTGHRDGRHAVLNAMEREIEGLAK